MVHDHHPQELPVCLLYPSSLLLSFPFISPLPPFSPSPPILAHTHTFNSQTRANKTKSLAAVNFFLGCVGVVQVSRIALHDPKKALEAAKVEAKEVKDEVKDTKA